MRNETSEDEGRELGDLELYPVDERRLSRGALAALVEVQLGLCGSRPYTDVDEMFEDFDRDLPEHGWSDDFMANPFRLGSTERELGDLSQAEFEQAFAKEPIWCLHHMASYAEDDPGLALVYEGCARLVTGQIIRAVRCSEGRLDAEPLANVANETMKYTIDLDSRVPVGRLETMLDAIRGATSMR